MENDPHVAYLILVHRFPEQFKRLFKAIYHPQNHYLIHIDLKAAQVFTKTLKSFYKTFQI